MTEMTLTVLAITLGLPLAAAALAATAGRALPGVTPGSATAAGILLGALAGQVAIGAAPRFPPAGAVDKLPWLALSGIALAAVHQHFTQAVWQPYILPAGIALGIVWVGWPRLAIPDTAAWLAALTVWGGSIWVLRRLDGLRPTRSTVIAASVAVALSGVAVYSSSYSMAQLVAVSLAALLGAVVAGRGSFGIPARMALAGPLIGLLTMLALYTTAAPLALLLLLAIPLAPGIAERVEMQIWPATPRGAPTSARHLLVLGAVALLPAIAAIAVAQSNSGPLYY